MTDLFTLAAENGFSHTAPLNMSALTPLQAVRDMCTADRCGRYGKSWSCPPACGSIEAAAARMAQYNKGILVQTTGSLQDSFDYASMQAIGEQHKTRFLNFTRQARLLYPGCLSLSAGSCTVCHSCTYPNKPCRYPNRRIASMEAMGLFVSDVCTRSGLGYNYGANTLTYTSCILYKEA